MDKIKATHYSIGSTSSEQEDQRLHGRSVELKSMIDETAVPFDRTDDYRMAHASYNGGFELRDPELLGKHRSVITEMIGVSQNFP